MWLLLELDCVYPTTTGIIKVAGKQKIGSLTVFFSCCVHKEVILFYLRCCYAIALYIL